MGLAGELGPARAELGDSTELGTVRCARAVDADQMSFDAVEAGAYEGFYIGLREALETGGPPPVDPRDALAALRVIEAARRSAADRTVIELEEET